MHLGYQNLNDVPDAEKFMQETKLAIEAEAMGFEPLVRRAWVIDLVPLFETSKVTSRASGRDASPMH